MLCDECCHLIYNNICRCTEGKVIGCMYIELNDGCIFYDNEIKKRCKNKTIETEFGKLDMCIQHNLKTKKSKVTKTVKNL